VDPQAKKDNFTIDITKHMNIYYNYHHI